MNIGFCASSPVDVTRLSGPQLGPLDQLFGTWVGSGFNLISLPDKHDGKPFRLKLNATRETLTFVPIGAPIPNRGSVQDDIAYLGLHYLQMVNDSVTLEALHLEPGLWLNVPATTSPLAPPSVVRQASIPHGDSLLAQGPFFPQPGDPPIVAPIIAPVDSTPIDATTGKPVTDPKYLAPFLTTPLPPGIPVGAIANPNLLLTNAIIQQTAAGQNIRNTIVLQISTAPSGGIVNIPFINVNANATRLDAMFWIETIRDSSGNEFLQLQYTQTVILNFLGINWPHISVATLVKR